MGYKDYEKQKAFQNAWLKKRRLTWVKENGPCKKCRSAKRLRVVKNDASLTSSKVWSYSDEYRKEALKKCIVLCNLCTRKHYAEILCKNNTGNPRYSTMAVLSAEHVWAIRGRLLGRESARAIGRAYGVHHSIISDIRLGKAWSYLKGGRRAVFGLQKKRELSE